MPRLLAFLMAVATPLFAAAQDTTPTPNNTDDPTRAAVSQYLRPLTLSDLEQIAFRNNPTLAGASARLEAARGRQVQAGLYPNPVIGYHATEIGVRDTAGQQGGFVTQRIITGGKRKLDRAIAGKAVDEAFFRLRTQEQRVLSDLRTRFYHALVAQRRFELSRELARIGDELVKATQKLLAARLGTENDLLQAEIRADEAHILLDNSANHQVEAWRRLAAVAGITNLQATPLVGRLENEAAALNWEHCVSAAIDNNPELNAARMRVQRAELVVRRAKREPIPNIDVSVSVRHHDFTSDDVANLQIGVPIPVFDNNRGNIRSAEAQWIAAQSEVRRIELSLQDRLAVEFRRYANAKQQTERYSKRMLPRAIRSLELVTEGYEKRQVEYLTLLTAQQTYIQVNLSYLDALRELWAATSRIEGQLQSDSLAQRP